MSSKHTGLAAAAALAASLLGACATAAPALEPELSADFGQAVAHNIAAMSVEPRPEDKADTFIPPSREHAARARANYREGTVPPPRNLSTRGDGG